MNDIKTYNNKKVLTVRTITDVTGSDHFQKKLYSAIKRKTNKLIANKDYIYIPSELFKEYRKEGDLHNYPRGGYLITAEGYMKVIGKEEPNNDILKLFGIKPVVNKTINPSTPIISDKEKSAKANKTDIPVTTSTNNISAPLDISLMQEMISNCNKVMDIQMQFIQQEREANAELRQIIRDMVSAVAIANDNKEKLLNIENVVFEIGNVEYSEWKKEINLAANKVISKNSKYKSTNDVLHDAYKLLNKEYGVVWEQEKKEFFNLEGRSPVNTLELEYWIETNKPTYKNLLISKINSLCHER